MLKSDGASPSTCTAPVSFYLADEPDLELVRRLDPDADLAHFSRGERSWVAQTYLRLRAAGYPVELVDRPPARGLVVFHAKHKHALSRVARGRPELVFVAIRADNSSPLLADFELLQNGRFVDDQRRFFVPFWPQPGLVPRDPGRGHRVERIGYKGLEENLHPDFRKRAWKTALREEGFEWVTQLKRYSEIGRQFQHDWVDYRDLDVMVSVRPAKSHLRYAKPANKLINAWRAGVPAVIGFEYACREIKQSDDDFIEVGRPADALAALRRLRDDPDLYARMVANGHRREAEYSFDVILSRWAEILFVTLPRRIEEGGLSWHHRLPLPLRTPVRRIVRAFTAGRSR